MRIATWNIERIKHLDCLGEILYKCHDVRADILVLTETDRRLLPDYQYCFQTPAAVGAIPKLYKNTENRVSIFTNYKCIRQVETYDKYTALCVELETERGNLMVYGTIMGIFGNRDASFMGDLLKQLDDIRRIRTQGYEICICGDFNCSFSDNYYFTKTGMDSILQVFADDGISILTKDRVECIDHIAVSNGFVDGADIYIDEWNYDKKLSDHKGIVVEIV